MRDIDYNIHNTNSAQSIKISHTEHIDDNCTASSSIFFARVIYVYAHSLVFKPRQERENERALLMRDDVGHTRSNTGRERLI